MFSSDGSDINNFDENKQLTDNRAKIAVYSAIEFMKQEIKAGKINVLEFIENRGFLSPYVRISLKSATGFAASWPRSR